MAEKRSGFRLWAIGVFCGLLLSCASQSPPQPPRVERPEPVRDFAVEQVGGAIRLRFTLPTRAVDGEDLTKPLEIEILRSRELPGTNTTSSQAAPGSMEQVWLSLRPSDLKAEGGPAEYAAEIAPDEFKRIVGETLRFEIRTLTRGFRGRAIESAPSNPVTVTLLDVPRPVTGFGAEVTERALDLHWSMPSETLTGQAPGPVSSYRVYRSEGDSASAAQANPYRVVGDAYNASYADENFEFGRAYSYKVRAVVTGNGSSAESQDSAAVEIVPRDVFPPAAPTGLTGLYTSGAIELIWSPNSEPDLAGYNVRRREDTGRSERLNRELLRSPLDRDTTVIPGHHYFYQATAVDSSGNESAPSAEIEVEAQ